MKENNEINNSIDINNNSFQNQSEYDQKTNYENIDIDSIKDTTISNDYYPDLNNNTISNPHNHSTTDNNTNQPPLPKIDNENQRFPFCLVWCPIPCITAILPFIGHTGFCTSTGIIHDFAGPYYVGVDDMAFGAPCKYLQFEPNEQDMEEWDNAVEKGDHQFSKEMHHLITNNCHTHCAYILNQLNYNNKSNYTMIHIWWMISTKSKYISWSHVFKTYIGFIILIVFISLIISLITFPKW